MSNMNYVGIFFVVEKQPAIYVSHEWLVVHASGHVEGGFECHIQAHSSRLRLNSGSRVVCNGAED